MPGPSRSASQGVIHAMRHRLIRGLSACFLILAGSASAATPSDPCARADSIAACTTIRLIVILLLLCHRGSGPALVPRADSAQHGAIEQARCAGPCHRARSLARRPAPDRDAVAPSSSRCSNMTSCVALIH